MPTNTRVDDLKINKLTVSQYRNAVANHTIGENEISVLTDAIIVQTDTMPIASAEYDGKIIQYTGITSSPYVCGYFYICTGSSDVYNWNQINVQPEKDAHNLGYYSTPEDLALAHPTATAGDYAIVNSTDTVWIWDTDTSSWKDGDTQGQVTSVNNQTGDVVLTASDLGAQEELVSQVNIKSIDGNSLLGSGNLELFTYLPFPNSWTTNSTTKAFCDDVAADASAVAGKAYLGEVLFSDLNTIGLVNGEVVVEIMAGSTAASKVIVLRMTSGNHAPYQWQYTYWNGGSDVSGWVGFQPELPSQSGQSGKFLTTNGSGLSWGTVDALPSQTSHSGEFLTTDGTDANWSPLATVATTGSYNDLEDQPEIPTEARQVGAIPELGSMPTADAEYENLIVQYSGSTTPTYTNGYFYRCDSTLVSAASATISQIVGSTLSDLAVVAADFESFYPETGIYDFVFDGVDWYYNEDFADLTSLGITYSGVPDEGDTIEVDFTATEYSYAWNRVDVQPGSTLPSQTGNAGKFLTTNGTNASWNNSLSNEITFSFPASTVSTILSWGTTVSTQTLQVDSQGYFSLPSMSRVRGTFYVNEAIGGAWNVVRKVYTQKLSSGGNADAEITVPDVAGKMAVQVSTVPTADSALEGQIYQFTGATDATYTNGRFYKCVSDGQATPTYSWEEVSMGGSSLPSQTGNAGKFLTTDGTDVSWGDALVNKAATSVNNTTLFVSNTTTGNTYSNSTIIGMGAYTTGVQSVAVGAGASGSRYGVAVGRDSGTSADYAISIGRGTRANANYAIQIGEGQNSDANTFKVGNANGNFEIMSANGTIPSDRLIHAINKYSTMPTASSTNLGWIVQFTGTTDSTYTHGHLYECVSDGQDPATYSWTEVQLGGGSSLPSQTGHSGEFLTTDGTDASWGSPIVATFKVWGANE